jgi:gliding motility-associated lipoprotein GldH
LGIPDIDTLKIMRQKLWLNLFISLISSLLWSCNSETFPVMLHPLKNSIWAADQDLVFDFQVQNPSQTVDMLYQVQYDRGYAFENIWLKYWLIGPKRDTLIRSRDNLFLFEPKTGRPIGTGPPERLFLDAYFLKKVRLEDTGKYTLRIRQYMRKDSLEGIQSLGIKIREPEDL